MSGSFKLAAGLSPFWRAGQLRQLGHIVDLLSCQWL
jgi:hypothetical protein